MTKFYFESLSNIDKDILIISGNNENWHGHVTAVTCAPAHRRLGLAGRLMDALEKISEQKKCWFVDLFVRVSNTVAITMYKVSHFSQYRKECDITKLPKVVLFKSLFFLYQNLGYVVYRTVLQYYSGETDEDAYDMRKALSRDRDKKTMIPLSKGYVHMDELEY